MILSAACALAASTIMDATTQQTLINLPPPRGSVLFPFGSVRVPGWQSDWRTAWEPRSAHRQNIAISACLAALKSANVGHADDANVGHSSPHRIVHLGGAG